MEENGGGLCPPVERQWFPWRWINSKYFSPICGSLEIITYELFMFFIYQCWYQWNFYCYCAKDTCQESFSVTVPRSSVLQILILLLYKWLLLCISFIYLCIYLFILMSVSWSSFKTDGYGGSLHMLSSLHIILAHSSPFTLPYSLSQVICYYVLPFYRGHALTLTASTSLLYIYPSSHLIPSHFLQVTKSP